MSAPRSRTRNVLVAALCLAGLTTPVASAHTAAETWQHPVAATNGHELAADVTVPMRDGTTLVGDVLYPTDLATGERAKGTFPVLLVQNPYYCDTTASSLALSTESTGGSAYYADRGYVYASICVRGTGRSGGEFDLWGPEQVADGVELVRWARDLEGSNGSVGLIGCSYLGMTQLLTAAKLPKGSGVKTIVPLCAGAEFYREAAFSGGMPTDTAITLSTRLGRLMGPRAGAWGAAQAANIASGGDRAFDGTWSKARTPGEVAGKIADLGIPALLWSGYDDMFALGSQEMYTYLQNAHAHRPVHGQLEPTRPTTPRYQLVIGPWGHGDGFKEGEQNVLIHWLDTWLKGTKSGLDATSTPLHAYQRGSGKWINTTTVTPVRDYTTYHLAGGGRLASTKPRTDGSDAIGYTAPTASNGSLTYTTEPFRGGATIAGPISASLVARTTGTDLTLIGTLADVAPDGTATTISTGSLVGSQRELDRKRTWYDRDGTAIRPYGTFTSAKPLTPGQDYRLEFPMSSRFAEVAPGHALRLTVTTQALASACGQLLGYTPCFPTAPQRAALPGDYRLELGDSRINVPLARYGCFPASGGTGVEPTSFRGPVRSCS